ncbi:MAG: TVP38/TMEM64 family protein [Candidatus Puniceispirillaceae bacterium]
MSSAIRATAKRLWLPAILVVGLGIFLATGAHRFVQWEVIALHYGQIKSWATSQLVLAGLGFCLAYMLAVAFSLPVALPLTLTGGAVFGWLALPLVLTGATVGAGLVFIAVRTAFGDLARRRAGPFLARLEDGFSTNAFSYLLALRLIPAAPFWVINIVPALTRMTLRSFLAATFIGIAPGTAVFVSVGRGLDHVLAAGRTPDLEILASPAILGPLVALGLLALMPVVWKRIRAARDRTGPGTTGRGET